MVEQQPHLEITETGGSQPVYADQSEGPPRVEAADGSAGQLDREAMPIGNEQPPRLAFTVVGVGASAGGLEAYTEFLQHCRSDSGMAFVLIQHLSPKHQSMMAELLQKHSAMPVAQVEDSLKVEPNHVYVIRPGYTMTIHDGHLHLGESASEPMHRRPVDDFFKSLAEEQRERSIAVVLSGTGSNGTLGCESIKTVGGFCIAQEPESAKFPSMPRSVIDSNLADAILRPGEMFAAIEKFAKHSYASAGPANEPEAVAKRERLALGELIAVLRARTRHDFSVYKKPTLIRRIQRRMSLMQIESMAEYVRALRQTPSEVVALCDDLMIHVTGFFRDSEVWESLRDRVIRPLVAEKSDNGTLRCWVTACSSGEEAYTIGMLLLEAAEAAGKHFDIKIFATDTAERSLSQARSGVFPGGIESEITPERIARFFERDDSFYRVKKELRELVVFAPQNVLQDPPFSRLDICTCRNLLIYIEGETQQRILSMLHFGLREGGTLVLGNSETIAGAEELFEPIDKQNRIYRRVGPTRHGTIDFPVPQVSLSKRVISQLSGEGSEEQPRPLTRATIAQLATKTLLDLHTPAAVVVDRTGQIVYFHGSTDRFLAQPTGEPTRDVMMMAREEVRGGVRSVLQRVINSGESVHHRDGTLGEGADRERVELTAAPLGGHAGQLYFLVSFATRPDVLPTMSGAENDGRAADMALELRRVRDELQSTIEELQTSNEEMKASHEEVTSINEELQSTNEELETSKEELQSLNEELSTVNAQLQAKMEELERTGNDLSSLLTSTDIAVIFLDRNLRIRRFTQATKKLMDLIPSDLGRPFADLARRFEDPALAEDTRRVLETLLPAEAPVSSSDGRTYDRRVLPYRTADDRIDGVVITFVDVTERLLDRQALEASEFKYRTLFGSIDEGFCIVEMLYDESGRPNDYRFLEVNPAFERQTGLSGALGRRILELVPNHERHWFDIYGGIAESGEPTRFEQSAAAHGRYNDVYAFRIGEPAEHLVAILFTDITRRREDEDRQAFLLKLTDVLRPVADTVSIQSGTCRVLGEHLGVGRAYFVEIDEAAGTATVRRDYVRGDLSSITGVYRLDDYGWSLPVLRVGKTVLFADVNRADLVPPADRPPLIRLQVVAHVAVPVVKAGVLVGCICVSEPAPRTWTPGEVTLIEETAERIWAAVERARTEEALRESEGQYRTLAANLPGGAAFVVDRDLRYRLAEGEALATAGFKPADFEGKTLREALPPDVAAEYEMNYRRALAGESFRHEHQAHGRWYVSHGTPLRDTRTGEITGVLAVSYDITDRKAAEHRLDTEQRRFELVVQNLPDYAIFLLDPEGLITGWWEGAKRVTGYENSEVRGRHFRIFYPPELAAEPDRELATAAATGRYEGEGWRVRPDGTRYWVNEIVTTIHSSAGEVLGFAKIARDLTERRRVSEEMRVAKETAEAAGHAKDEFLAVLSHELRTPLSSILLWSKLLSRQPLSAAATEAVEAITRSADAQKQLIEDLLDTSRIASGKLRLELQLVELSNLVLTSIESVSPTAQAKGVTLRSELGKNIGTVLADPDRLQQVVWNLLNNAVKFTPAGKGVEVSLRRSDGAVRLSVVDEGKGIDAAFLPHVFEAFRQAESSTTRASGGLGLGLAICKQLVEAHGGTIHASSPGIGHGAEFVVDLPLPAVRSGRLRTTTDSPDTAAVTLGGLRILLVEDDAQARRAMGTLLEERGATVTVAASAAEAMALLDQPWPDVILSDIGMPDEDGYSLIRKVRAKEKADNRQRVPAVALTAFATPADRQKAVDAGFDHHVTKPLDPDNLSSLIRSLIDAIRRKGRGARRGKK